MDNVSYLGIEGSFSSIAASRYFSKNAHFYGCVSVQEIIQDVDSSKTQYGVLPIENSVSGSVAKNYDALLKSSVSVCGEIYLRIAQNLVGKKGTTLKDIRTVYSHPEALNQCDEFLQSLGVARMEMSDTATAAKYVAAKEGIGDAAIASLKAAKLYDLSVVKRGIETNKANFTRFLIICKDAQTVPDASKISILFTLKHKPGTLYNALGELNKRRLNFTKIESRPMLGKPFEYMFYMDFECQNRYDAQEAIEAMKDKTETLRILGMYKRGEMYEE